MSRSGYGEDCDDTLQYGRWRAQVASATRGKRGQKFFKDLLEALDAMPSKRLITEQLQSSNGEFCTLGVLGNSRSIRMDNINEHDHEEVGKLFDISHQLAAEVVYMNDEYFEGYSPEKRWERMREWVSQQIRKEQT